MNQSSILKILVLSLFVFVLFGFTDSDFFESSNMQFDYEFEVSSSVSGDTSNVSFNLPKSTKVKVYMYDLHGKILKRIANAEMKKGKQSFQFSTKEFPEEVYIFYLRTTEYSEQKMILLRKN